MKIIWGEAFEAAPFPIEPPSEPAEKKEMEKEDNKKDRPIPLASQEQPLWD